jgi:hypothetical protein
MQHIVPPAGQAPAKLDLERVPRIVADDDPHAGLQARARVLEPACRATWLATQP